MDGDKHPSKCKWINLLFFCKFYVFFNYVVINHQKGGDCNEHDTIYAISSDFGDRIITQSMGLMVLLSEHFYIPGMKQKGHTKQNMKKELKQTLNWTSSAENRGTGRTDAYSIGASDGCRKIRRLG